MNRLCLAVLVLGLTACIVPCCVAEEGGAEGARAPYRIGIEDVLEINVWGHEDVSREVWVRPDGCITLPLIGEIRVEGSTTADLTKLLTEKFTEYLKAPTVTVSLVEIHSYTVYILGRVMTPGAIPLRSPRTFLQVLTMAGGFQEFADTDSIVLVRWEEGKEKRIPVDAKAIIAKGTKSDFVVLPGDVIVVP